MEEELCKLTLVYPQASEDAIVELLLKAEPPLKGFTTWAADGHGLDFGDATTAERVRGRILLETVRAEAGAPHLAYWVEPVESFGRL